MEPILIEATYENGTLKPDRPLPLSEHQRVRVPIQITTDPVATSFGMFGWKGRHGDSRKDCDRPGVRRSGIAMTFNG